MKNNEYQPQRSGSPKRLGIAIAVIIILFVLMYLIFGQLMTPMKISGQSMEPNMHDDDMIYVNKLWISLDYGNICVFNREGASNMSIKRVVGKGGDIISIIDGKLHRNGVAVVGDAEEYMQSLRESGCPNINDKGEYTVPSDSYFLLGDNRNNSLDSRYYGSIKKDKIVGKVLFK